MVRRCFPCASLMLVTVLLLQGTIWVRAVAPVPGNGPLEPVPHPILSDVRVRQAIAHCTDKDALIAAAYPGLTPAQRQALAMDTILPAGHWAYSAPATTYPFGPVTGGNLLDAAGWTLPPGGDYRMKGGKELALTLDSNDSPMRQAFLAVFETQMKACGIRLIRRHNPTEWFYGNATGMANRDFELGEWAWVGGADAYTGSGAELYGCTAIPSPANGWEGQNYMGWCNLAASAAIVEAARTDLTQAERKPFFATFIDLFAADLPSLPLFMRQGGTADAFAWEHIDFGLQTFVQTVEVVPGAASILNYTDFAGNQGTVSAPAGVVADAITLSYRPLKGVAHPLPEGLAMAKPFRLFASVEGVPQETFAFSQPVTVAVAYDDGDLWGIWDEGALDLLYWDGAAWQRAYKGCPKEDRTLRRDLGGNRFEVTVCHLSEFALVGSPKDRAFLPLTRR